MQTCHDASLVPSARVLRVPLGKDFDLGASSRARRDAGFCRTYLQPQIRRCLIRLHVRRDIDTGDLIKRHQRLSPVPYGRVCNDRPHNPDTAWRPRRPSWLTHSHSLCCVACQYCLVRRWRSFLISRTVRRSSIGGKMSRPSKTTSNARCSIFSRSASFYVG